MRLVFVQDIDDERLEFNSDTIKKLLVYALEEGKTPEEAVDYLEEQIRHKFIRT